MPINPDLEARLAKPHAPSTRIDENFRGKEISFITDKAGQAVALFIGKRNSDGSIAGERYARKIQYAPDGQTIIKSHWDNKGKVSRA